MIRIPQLKKNNINKVENETDNKIVKNNEKNKDIININDDIKNINTNNNNNNSKENQNQNKNIIIYNNESHISVYNPGKEFYERRIKFKENEKEKLEALKKNLEVEKEEYNTFTPKINKISEMQKERIKEKRLECTNPDIINNYKQYKNEKMEIL